MTSRETVFRPGVESVNSLHVSETTGAFDEINLSHDSNSMAAQRDNKRITTYTAPNSYRQRVEIADENSSYAPSVRFYDRDQPLLTATALHPTYAQQLYPYPEDTMRNPYLEDSMRNQQYSPHRSDPENKSRPTSAGNVYSNSNGAVDFAVNFEKYLTSIIHPYVWIVLMLCLIVWGLIILLIGMFNVPFCPSQPMIPIYLIVAGILYMIWASQRIYSFWPTARSDSNSGSLGADLICKLLEGLICVGVLVWLFLGCFWVYGPKRFVHFEDNMFERNYCDVNVYWIAFINVTLHLALIAIGVAVIACILCMGMINEA